MRLLIAAHALALWALCAMSAPATELHAASYPEGPVWIDGTLYWAEMGADRVMADADGEVRAFFRRTGCGPTAVAPYRTDEFLVLCHRDGSLVRLDANGKAVETIRADADGQVLRNPNDATADGGGGVWFTDPGRFSVHAPAEGALWHLAPDGRMTRHVAGLAYGNGVHLDRAGQRLLLSEHLARRVLAFPLREGTLGRPEILIDLDSLGLRRSDYPEAGPDGLEVDANGVLWVAEYGAGRLLAWHPEDGFLGSVSAEPQFLTNIAVGSDGSAALTGAYQNARPPFEGGVWLTTVSDLRRRLVPAAD